MHTHSVINTTAPLDASAQGMNPYRGLEGGLHRGGRGRRGGGGRRWRQRGLVAVLVAVAPAVVVAGDGLHALAASHLQAADESVN